MTKLEVETVNNKTYQVTTQFTFEEFLDHVAYAGANSLVAVQEGKEYISIDKLVRVKVIE